MSKSQESKLAPESGSAEPICYAKKAPEKRRYGSYWICQGCLGNPEFDHAEMMTHLQEVHGIDTKTTKGTKTMMTHMDGTDWFASQHEWDINGLKCLQTTTCKRSAESKRYWA